MSGRIDHHHREKGKWCCCLQTRERCDIPLISWTTHQTTWQDVLWFFFLLSYQWRLNNRAVDKGSAKEESWWKERRAFLKKKNPIFLLLNRGLVHVERLSNQQLTLNKLPTELWWRNLVNNHRLSIQFDAKGAKTCMQCIHIPTELPFCIPPPLVVGYSYLH